uniref:Uncharacterized protein n=1 Tax=viral metagenome TaxID=1070528 RepID=A0A6C0HRS8_9ZZZZ
MICEFVVYYSLSLSYTKLFILFALNILYFFRFTIYKWCVLFLFKKIKYGNISFIERSAVLKSDYTLEQVDKELLNVVNHPNDPNVIIYITNEKFYENFLFYGELGLEKSFNFDFYTENLYELFEIIYSPPSPEWIIYKNFSDAFNLKSETEVENTLDYNNEEFIFHVDESSDFSTEKIKIVIHNGNFDFKNTSISNATIFTDKEISKKIIYKRVERFVPTGFSDKSYYDTFLKFLFEKNYLSLNTYFK